MRHMFLYLNDLDVVGLIYTSSMFHFQGDGEHTLGRKLLPAISVKVKMQHNLHRIDPRILVGSKI